MRVQDSASIRCIYAYVQMPTTDGQSAYLVKVSRDDGATWELLEYMGIAQKLPDGYKNTYDWLVDGGYGKPATRRLPYNDFGIFIIQDVTLGRASRPSTRRRTARTGWASMWASSSTSTSGKQTRSMSRCSPRSECADVRCDLHEEPQHRRDRASDDLADCDPQRGRQPRVRYPGGRQPDPGSDLTVVIQT